MIILYIALWLLTGFLAAWVAHVLIHKREYHMTNDVLLTGVILGPIALCYVVGTLLFDIIKYSKPLFKAKEPK